MNPTFFRVGETGVPAYFVLLLSGFLFAIALQALGAKRIGQNPDAMVDLGISMLLWGLVGSRVLHVLADGYLMDYVHLCTDPEKVSWRIERQECLEAPYDGLWDPIARACHPRHTDCFAWAKFWAGGLSYYGGFLGASVAAWFSLKRDKFPFWVAADLAGITVPVGLAFGRVGCFFGGCCFGAECTLPWSVVFPPGSDASRGQWKAGTLASPYLPSHAVHPTQLYEALFALGLAAAALFWVWPRKRYHGQVFAFFLGAYAIGRAIIEVWRRDDRGGALGLSTSQLIGIGLLAVALIIHARRGKKEEQPT